jgi:hypothetical protein
VVFEDKTPRTPDELFQPKALKRFRRIIDKYAKNNKIAVLRTLGLMSSRFRAAKSLIISSYQHFHVGLFYCLPEYVQRKGAVS